MDIEEITNILGEKYEYTYKTVGGIDMHLVQTVRKTDASNNTLTLTYGLRQLREHDEQHADVDRKHRENHVGRDVYG